MSNLVVDLKPELKREWSKNNTLDFNSITKGSHKKALWNCFECGSEYESSIANKFRGQGCSYCSGSKVNHTNSLQSKNPLLAKEWSAKNKKKPSEVTANSSMKAWWKCSEEHEWESTVRNRMSGNGCPYCSGRNAIEGETSVYITHPHIAKLFLNENEAKILKVNSFVKVDWKCHCGTIIRDKSVSNVFKRGLSCPLCKDSKSYPERVVFFLLKQLEIEFSCEKMFEWAKDKRYDFFIPSKSCIIEVHGEQHYKDSTFGSKTIYLKDTKESDHIKEELAKNNGIANYIVVKADKSDLGYLIKMIENSGILNIACLESKDINWVEIGENALKNTSTYCAKLWNSGMSVGEIADSMKIDRHTVTRYLKLCSSVGLCDYAPKKCEPKKISQFTLSGKFVREWDSLTKITKELDGLYPTSITKCCKGEYKQAGGFIWKYSD